MFISYNLYNSSVRVTKSKLIHELRVLSGLDNSLKFFSVKYLAEIQCMVEN